MQNYIQSDSGYQSLKIEKTIGEFTLSKIGMNDVEFLYYISLLQNSSNSQNYNIPYALYVSNSEFHLHSLNYFNDKIHTINSQQIQISNDQQNNYGDMVNEGFHINNYLYLPFQRISWNYYDWFNGKFVNKKIEVKDFFHGSKNVFENLQIQSKTTGDKGKLITNQGQIMMDNKTNQDYVFNYYKNKQLIQMIKGEKIRLKMQSDTQLNIMEFINFNDEGSDENEKLQYSLSNGIWLITQIYNSVKMPDGETHTTIECVKTSSN